MALALSGCASSKLTPASVKTRTETELAIAAVKSEWLKRCDMPSAGVPENNIGALLQDYLDVASALAECSQRLSSFIEYMEPIVKKEQARVD